MKQVHLKVSFQYENGQEIGEVISTNYIREKSNREIGSLRLHSVTPLITCSKGGRHINIFSEHDLSKNVSPVFLVYNAFGARDVDQERHLKQVVPEDYVTHKGNLKGYIQMITPPQQHLNKLNADSTIKLTLQRQDGTLADNPFGFMYTPHTDHQCMYCMQDNSLHCHSALTFGNIGESILKTN